MEHVFTSEYMEFDIDSARADVEIAKLRLTLLEVLHAAGVALHSNFVGGDEAKWQHPSQRESLIELSNACKLAMASQTPSEAPATEHAA